MFRLLIVALAVVGLFSLLSGALGTAATGFGILLLVPIVLFKVFLVLMILGFFARGFASGGGRGPGRRGRRQPASSREDRFEEWHRMAHAREEVDSWVDGMPDARQE